MNRYIPPFVFVALLMIFGILLADVSSGVASSAVIFLAFGAVVGMCLGVYAGVNPRTRNMFFNVSSAVFCLSCGYILESFSDFLPQFSALRHHASLCNDWASLKIDHTFADNETASLLQSMLIGRRESMPVGLKELYRSVGASHILALSGLHLGILTWIVNVVLLRFLTVPWLKRILVVMSLAVVWSYALIAGLPYSLVRASVMSSFFIIAVSSGHGINVWHTLSLAAVVVLAFSPRALWDVGFQLSFLSVIGLVVFHGRIKDMFGYHGWWHPIWTLVSVSLAAQLGTLPLVAYYFHQIPLYSAVFNVPFVIITYAIFFLAIVSLLTGWGWMVTCTTHAVHFQHDLMYLCNLVFGGVWENLHPTSFFVLCLYLVIFSIGWMWANDISPLRRWWWTVWIMGTLAIGFCQQVLVTSH